MKTLPIGIDQVADELRRLDPAGCGDDAGYRSYEGDTEEWSSIGWYAACGNVGHSVLSVHPDDIAEAVSVLRQFPDGAANVSGPASLSYDPAKQMRDAGVRCEWHV